MPNICDFSGVHPAGCAHCRDLDPTPATVRGTSASAPFRARFDGTCGSCGFDIKVGEHVRYVDDELAHTGCAHG